MSNYFKVFVYINYKHKRDFLSIVEGQNEDWKRFITSFVHDLSDNPKLKINHAAIVLNECRSFGNLFLRIPSDTEGLIQANQRVGQNFENALQRRDLTNSCWKCCGSRKVNRLYFGDPQRPTPYDGIYEREGNTKIFKKHGYILWYGKTNFKTLY